MKTAISVNDALMEEADAAALGLGLSRSALIAMALRDFLKRRASAEITQRLNAVYASDPAPDEKRLIRSLKTKLHVSDNW